MTGAYVGLLYVYSCYVCIVAICLYFNGTTVTVRQLNESYLQTQVIYDLSQTQVIYDTQVIHVQIARTQCTNLLT